MQESIKQFGKQFEYVPEIINQFEFENCKKFVIGGMGGSHLAGGILQMILPNTEIYIHRDYGIPERYLSSDFVSQTLFIASSYSGNTEEVLDFADEVYSRGLKLMIVSTGGKLIDFAKENNIAYIQIPDTGIQPRMALGYSLVAFSKIIYPEMMVDLGLLKNIFSSEKISEIEKRAFEFVTNFENKIPIIYTSSKNRPIAYNWKIKFNETAKIPAFYNSFPELNHNEMQGYDFNERNKDLFKNFMFVFIKSENEHPSILNRMKVLENIYQEKGYDVLSVDMSGDSIYEKILSTILLADFIALGLAEKYDNEPEKVALIEDFKKRLAE